MVGLSRDFGAISRSHASHGAAKASPPIGFDRGEGAWVEALCLFYERDCLPQKAANIRNGAPLDYLDLRAIEALKAALNIVERKAA
jgi:hypothetical protein